ncbi:MAG TPA: ergothioneine biosynthesis protein EgtB [Terracidiphilus sp.]
MCITQHGRRTPIAATTTTETDTALAAKFRTGLLDRFRAVRNRTLDLVAPLTPEDMMVQSCPEASPVKWHLAHTAWFFESFILKEFLPAYRVFNPDFVWLFNSYYQTFAAFPDKRLRSSFSRPALDEILRFRSHVDEAIDRLFDSDPAPEALVRIELGLNHEEQHQELILTDILYAFFTNPLRPAYKSEETEPSNPNPDPIRFVPFEVGLVEVGHTGSGFCFDNELPRHRVWLEPYSLANRLVTCAEYAEFIADGGYRRPELWLSDGWNAVQENNWRAPLYWNGEEDARTVFTLYGQLPFDLVAASPVSQISYYEADAYAHWAGCRLPTEFEWETAAESETISGNLLETLRPLPPSRLVKEECSSQLFGDTWEWTASAYLNYPGFRPLPGSLGEYNGKFMSGQMVLRGGSCCTPPGHIRASYRNFFAPATRWQFSGIRLAGAFS